MDPLIDSGWSGHWREIFKRLLYPEDPACSHPRISN